MKMSRTKAQAEHRQPMMRNLGVEVQVGGSQDSSRARSIRRWRTYSYFQLTSAPLIEPIP